MLLCGGFLRCLWLLLPLLLVLLMRRHVLRLVRLPWNQCRRLLALVSDLCLLLCHSQRCRWLLLGCRRVLRRRSLRHNFLGRDHVDV